MKLFDPCTQISDDALRAAGVDPATKESGVAGVHQHGWEICGWEGKSYDITVFSTAKPVDKLERKPGNIEPEDVVIAGRKGRQFRTEGAASYDRVCDVLIPAGQGTFQITVHSNPIMDNPPPPCPALHDVAEALVPQLPS